MIKTIEAKFFQTFAFFNGRRKFGKTGAANYYCLYWWLLKYCAYGGCLRKNGISVRLHLQLIVKLPSGLLGDFRHIKILPTAIALLFFGLLAFPPAQHFNRKAARGLSDRYHF